MFLRMKLCANMLRQILSLSPFLRQRVEPHSATQQSRILRAGMLVVPGYKTQTFKPPSRSIKEDCYIEDLSPMTLREVHDIVSNFFFERT